MPAHVIVNIAVGIAAIFGIFGACVWAYLDAKKFENYNPYKHR